MTRFGIDLGHGIGPDRGAVGNIAEEKIINLVIINSPFFPF